MRVCTCPRGPVRDIGHHDRLRCSACSGWTPFGRPYGRERLSVLSSEVTSLMENLVADHATMLDDWSPARRGEVIRGSGPSDPTGAAIADQRRAAVRAWVVLASRLLERALADVRRADEAIGEALYTIDPGPPERAEGTWYPPTEVSVEIEEMRAYQAKRRARGEV